MKRDVQKSRVYKSEWACSFYQHKQTIPSDQLQEWTENNILSKSWFRKRYGNRYPKVELGRSRGVAYGSSLIRLGLRMRNPWVICHEVAHTLNVGDHHGAAFTRTLLFLIERTIGKAEAEELERSMRANGVKINPKSWLPKPDKNPEPYDFNRIYKYKKPKVRRTTIKNVESVARKMGARVEFKRIADRLGHIIPGEWDLTICAPEGYTWNSEGTERATLSEDRRRIETYSYPESYMRVTIKEIKATDDNGWSWETHITNDAGTEVRQYKTGADRKGLYRMVENRWAEVFGDEFVVKGRHSVYGKAKRLAMKEVK
jgi:hypothetical protein